jgi:ParB-like chromosome segregation protein Spo0J
VKEFRPEDFGLSAEELERAGNDPTQAFGLLSQIYTRNPANLQNVMKRIAKRLQEKVQRGELRPQEIASEAEELIKEFTENPAMKDLMESFKSMFGFEDPEAARAVGRDGNSRLAIARNRLRKRMNEKKSGK